MQDHPFLTRVIRRMQHSGLQPMDADHPGAICGEQWWFEFGDRATAEQFQHDLIVFAQGWEPGP